MLLVNMSTGETLSFDFNQPAQRADWTELRRTRSHEITGLTLKHDGTLFSLPLPRDRFDRVECDAGPVEHRNGSGKVIGHRAIVFADDIQATVLAFNGNRPPMVRFSIERVGRPVFLMGGK